MLHVGQCNGGGGGGGGQPAASACSMAQRIFLFSQGKKFFKMNET